MNDSAYSTSSADATVGISTIPSSDSGEVTELFSKDIDDMVEMVAHWMKKKEELVEELIHLNDNVLVTNIHDPDGEVEKIVEKYLPKKEAERDVNPFYHSESSSSSTWLLV